MSSPNASAAQLARRHARMRVLTPDQVREARRSLESNPRVAQRLGLSTEAVWKMRRGETYGALTANEQAAEQERRRLSTPVFETPPPPTHTLTVGRLFSLRGGELDRQEAMDAVHECSHGRLPHDRTGPCGCWPQEIVKDQPQPQGGTNGNGHHPADRRGAYDQPALARGARPREAHQADPAGVRAAPTTGK